MGSFVLYTRVQRCLKMSKFLTPPKRDILIMLLMSRERKKNVLVNDKAAIAKRCT